MAFLAAALPYVGMAFSAMSAISGANAASQNAADAKAESRQAIAASREEAARTRRQVEQQQARVRAQSGGDLSGSPLEILLENAKQGELMAQDQLYAGQLTALGKKRQAALYKGQGETALLSGAGSIAGMAAKQFGK